MDKFHIILIILIIFLLCKNSKETFSEDKIKELERRILDNSEQINEINALLSNHIFDKISHINKHR